ncbi:hypothetical protein CALVIDRAFT_601495 [Calocera viscosa TUFC12733]|uniref:Uncharacterized protein n=1 Tax=Calocera viscosa (strain TUFC12733) TaxID=1330018 RepID=A0A167ICF9_CALVF|nr:hypothetical protein CALVIDRAFT_601495 [Calocera viscosa TUFC12733]
MDATIDFDIGGVHTSIANPLQRILIAEGESIGVDQGCFGAGANAAQDRPREAGDIRPGRTDWQMKRSSSLSRCKSRPPGARRRITATLPTCATIAASAPYKLWHSIGHQAHSLHWLFDPHTITEPNIVLLKLQSVQSVHAVLYCVQACARSTPIDPSASAKEMKGSRRGVQQWWEEWVAVGREEWEKRYEEMRELHGL